MIGIDKIPYQRHFYPRSPCGERLAKVNSMLTLIQISIHALLAESDKLQDGRNSQNIISIHALLAESDGRGGGLLFLLSYFYPRSPCGERHGNSCDT